MVNFLSAGPGREKDRGEARWAVLVPMRACRLLLRRSPSRAPDPDDLVELLLALQGVERLHRLQSVKAFLTAEVPGRVPVGVFPSPPDIECRCAESLEC